MEGAGAGEAGDLRDCYGETAWGMWGGDAFAMRQGVAGSSGSGQQNVAIQGARGTKRPASDEGDSVEEPGALSAEAKQRKAVREKARRVNLNGLFHDLAVLLDKDHPKAEKAGIVLDATKALKALREENDGLKQRNAQLERLNHMLMTTSGQLLQQSVPPVPQLPAAGQQLHAMPPRAAPPMEVAARMLPPNPQDAPQRLAPAAIVAAPLPEPAPVEQPPVVFAPVEPLPPVQPVQPLPPAKAMTMQVQQQQAAIPWWDLPYMFGEISELEDSLLRPPVA